MTKHRDYFCKGDDMQLSSKLVFALMTLIGLAATVTAQGPCVSTGGLSGCQSEGAHCQSNGHQDGCQAQCYQCQMTNEMVPVKKTVYETKCVPVCELHPGRICDCGPTCKFHFKKVLIKKEVVVGYKCVTKCSVQ